MSTSDLALRVRGLSKAYTIARDDRQESTLAETALARLKNPLRRPKKETFWALKDVEFDVKKGDVVGIIGRNGAGKSTLLKVLSRITEPTAGRIELFGRVGSLLEVGTGFHPELTGRENVYLNGNILGMSRAEIRKQFDAIVDFAGVEKFLDTPVKRYSSGMYVRLAFAVAAHLRSEILIVDEVLAVGDSEFQKKCLGKMKDVSSDGRTVLFVSHNMQAVSLLCTRCVVVRSGTLDFVGDTEDGVSRYVASHRAAPTEPGERERRQGTGEHRITFAAAAKQVFHPGTPIVISWKTCRQVPASGKLYVSAHVVDELGVTVAHCDSRLLGVWLDDLDVHEGRLEIRTPWLKPGSYRVDLFLLSRGFVDVWECACTFDVSDKYPYPHSTSGEATRNAVVLSDFQWTVLEGSPVESHEGSSVMA